MSPALKPSCEQHGAAGLRFSATILLLLCLTSARLALAAQPSERLQPDTSHGDAQLAAYFRAETAGLASRSLAGIKMLKDWQSQRGERRQQLFEMLGLYPLPQRTDLNAVTTGTVEHAEVTVERIHFQSRPKLYVTGNLYLPKGLEQPAPAILYLCGHGRVKKNGVSYGNKVHYQHHGAWLAQHGYVTLVIDTLQLGEIEGIHHGTYREGMWWWNSRGYTPAGVEAWNCIRALDYLETRKEVDAERIGVTGRSGGGAYSWWVAALDDRIKAAVPVAGITDLENHVVDGAVEGHCDCMYFVNTYGWDYADVAALVAPRPLLLANTDRDPIFPLDGVLRIHEKLRHIYSLHGAGDKLGLQISPGGHDDTPELQVAALRWLDRHLKGEPQPIKGTAKAFFEPEQLKVFSELPKDQENTRIHETFVPQAELPKVPENTEQWTTQRDAWLKQLKEKTFRGWPEAPGPLNVKQAFTAEKDKLRLTAYDFDSQQHVRLRLYLLHHSDAVKSKVIFVPIEGEYWNALVELLSRAFPDQLAQEKRTARSADRELLEVLDGMRPFVQSKGLVFAFATPRGVGLNAWDPDDREQPHIRRRFMLLGHTLAGMRVWDVRRGLQALRLVERYENANISLLGDGEMAAVAMYASLFEPAVSSLNLVGLAPSPQQNPDFLNIARILQPPAAVAMAAERSTVRLVSSREGWEFPFGLADKLGWKGRISVYASGVTFYPPFSVSGE